MRFDVCNTRDYLSFQEDNELRSFFHKFSEHVKQDINSRKEKAKTDNNAVKPSYDNLSLIITKLESLGITLNKNYLFASGFYKTTFYDGILKKIEFNELNITTFDLDFLEGKYKNNEEKFETISNTEHRYKLWLKENKGIDKKIQKGEEKVKKLAKEEEKKYKDAPISRWLASRSEYFDSVYELSKLTEQKELGQMLKKKLDFINSVTKEQALLIIELYSEVVKLIGKWDDYTKKIRAINNNINEKFSEICETVFNDMVNSSLVEINLNDIDRKIFKILVVNQLMGGVRSDLTKYDFDTDVVDWFVKIREENLIELFKITCSDLDEMLKEHSEKVLKK